MSLIEIFAITLMLSFPLVTVKWFFFEDGRRWSHFVDHTHMRVPGLWMQASKDGLEIRSIGEEVSHADRCARSLNMYFDRRARFAFWVSEYFFGWFVPVVFLSIIIYIVRHFIY